MLSPALPCRLLSDTRGAIASIDELSASCVSGNLCFRRSSCQRSTGAWQSIAPWPRPHVVSAVATDTDARAAGRRPFDVRAGRERQSSRLWRAGCGRLATAGFRNCLPQTGHLGCGLERQQSGAEIVCRSTRPRPTAVFRVDELGVSNVNESGRSPPGRFGAPEPQESGAG